MQWDETLISEGIWETRLLHSHHQASRPFGKPIALPSNFLSLLHKQSANDSKMSSPSSDSPSRSITSSDNMNAIPDDGPQEPDLPLTLASSMILTSLPRDAASALSAAGEFPKPKVMVHFKAVGSAPALRVQVCKISSTQRFEAVVGYLRKTLKVGPTDSVFLYVNSSFAPALDEIVGNLHRVSFFMLYFRSLNILLLYDR